jgi:hypothetical protein
MHIHGIDVTARWRALPVVMLVDVLVYRAVVKHAVPNGVEEIVHDEQENKGRSRAAWVLAVLVSTVAKHKSGQVEPSRGLCIEAVIHAHAFWKHGDVLRGHIPHGNRLPTSSTVTYLIKFRLPMLHSMFGVFQQNRSRW